ncbi:MAG: hypothetical protein IJE28_03565 [Oscillospiraceae bacterium]|nr:hypothetical protein [Oscillospiraceae bacterium]MBQ3500097.1 hypothetical protein [Oscillospiraceae bacterium]MBQ4643628.1 hypothetical protein [Oscillospiraceae bacterium]
MKRLFIILFALMLVLSGCGWEVEIVDPTEETQKTENSESEISVSELEETPENDSSPWYRNLSEHWQTDERLEKINIGGHEFKNGTCSVCRTEMEDLGDSIVLSDYSGDSKLLRKTTYNPDGSLTNDMNYKYDTDGNLVFESSEERFCTKDGSHYLTRITEFYYFSEIKQVHELNAFGDMLSSKSYNFGDELLSTYDYSYEYGENNLVEYQKTLFNGNPYMEIFFEIKEENGEFRSWKKRSIVYYDDGSRMESEFDENEDVISEIIYDAQGNIIE